MPGWRPLSVLVSLVMLGIVIELLRRRSLREKYAAGWLVLGVGVLTLSSFPSVATTLAHAVGIALASNLVFLLSGLVLAIVSLHLSGEVGRLEEEVRTSVEEVALLRCELADAHRALETRVTQLEAGQSELVASPIAPSGECTHTAYANARPS